MIPYATTSFFARAVASNSTGSVTIWKRRTAENRSAPMPTSDCDAMNSPIIITTEPIDEPMLAVGTRVLRSQSGA